jgi:tetratricopeptide (TPR) repeat protein
VGKKSRRKKERREKPRSGKSAADKSRPQVSDRRALEKTLRDLHRVLAEQDFASMDEANRFLSGLLLENDGKVPSRAPDTPLDKAQDLMYEAWDAEGAQRVALARRALELSPDCADAYVLLAEETAQNLTEARDLYAQGVAAGERALGEQMFADNVGHFWGILETRPYMRARLGLARCLWEAGDHEAAIEHCRELLRLNPNDNQGVRGVLLDRLLILRLDDEALQLLEQYRDDGTATWLYNWALCVFRREGDVPEARRRLKEAIDQNPHVRELLLGRKRLPEHPPDMITLGGEDEAAVYAMASFVSWWQTPGALDWLAAES